MDVSRLAQALARVFVHIGGEVVIRRRDLALADPAMQRRMLLDDQRVE